MATVEDTKEQVEDISSPEAVLPWEIEADGPRNDDIYIQTIPGCKLRSVISAMRTVKTEDAEGNIEESVPIDQARSLASIPKLPGMRLHINPAERTYEITDPLHGDEILTDRLQKWMESRTKIRTSGKLRGVKPVKGSLDVNEIKSLCREMLRIVEGGLARVVRGVLPLEEDINDLPGRYLLNPGARVENLQPRFEDEYEAWKERLKTL